MTRYLYFDRTPYFEPTRRFYTTPLKTTYRSVLFGLQKKGGPAHTAWDLYLERNGFAGCALVHSLLWKQGARRAFVLVAHPRRVDAEVLKKALGGAATPEMCKIKEVSDHLGFQPFVHA